MTSSSSPTHNLFSSKTFLARLAVGVTLINLLVFILVGLSLRQSHRQYQERAEVTTQNLVQVLENHIAGIIDKVDISLLAVTDEAAKQLAGGRIDAKALNALLARQQARLPELDSLRVADAEGIVSYGAAIPRGAKVDISDRNYFIRQRDDAGAGLVVSEPIFARINRKWVLPISRRIDNPDGSFAGIAYAFVALENFSRMFATLNVGAHGIVTLRDSDLGIVIRHPEPQGIGSVIGQKAAPQPLRDMVKAGRKTGTYLSFSTVDGTERTFSYRKVGNYPFLIIAGLATDDYLTAWHDDALKLAALTALFTFTTLVGTWLISRAWKRQRESVAALSLQEARFRTVADYTYDWEYWRGDDGKILYMTPSCERFTGYTREEFSADPALLVSIVHPDDQELMRRHLAEIAEREMVEMDFRIVRRDGQTRWIAHHCRAISGPDGAPLGRRISNRDVTDRVDATLALRRINETLEQRVAAAVADNMEKERLLIQQARLAAMGEMIGNIAHQWRQPLNTLGLLQANILDDFEFGELTRESLLKYTDRGQRLIQKMSSTIDDFRNFFRPHRTMEPFSLREAVERTLDIVRESYLNQGIAIAVAEQDDQQVTGFSNEFSQVLLNVLNNAKDAIQQSGVKDGSIAIELGHDELHAWISVTDNGGGIPTEILPKIFDPYFTTKESGTGIGLYMSKMIMSHMSGGIEARPLDGGTEFRLILPLTPPST
ncbi:MAG: PAS domain-containing protein [Sulfuricella sp.]|nr:PAS domain-containing protein [Sulfuricella sp.]